MLGMFDKKWENIKSKISNKTFLDQEEKRNRRETSLICQFSQISKKNKINHERINRQKNTIELLLLHWEKIKN